MLHGNLTDYSYVILLQIRVAVSSFIAHFQINKCKQQAVAVQIRQ